MPFLFSNRHILIQANGDPAGGYGSDRPILLESLPPPQPQPVKNDPSQHLVHLEFDMPMAQPRSVGLDGSGALENAVYADLQTVSKKRKLSSHESPMVKSEPGIYRVSI